MAMPQDLAGPVGRAGTSSVSVTFEPDGSTLVQLVGEVDLALRESLDYVAAQAIGRGRAVRVDVSEVTFMDSTGLALITRLAAAELEAGRQVRLEGVGCVLADLLRVSGLASMVA